MIHRETLVRLRRHGFTLIELLIVVAIIAILAAIAVPNFLEAQTRSKVSRTKADMRSLATAIEAYCVDTNHYPPAYGVTCDGRDSMAVLSTPTAYISAAKLVDPFATRNTTLTKTTLTYEAINGLSQIIETSPVTPYSVDPTDGAAKTIWWWVAARGPTKSFAGFGNSTPKMEQLFYESDTNKDAWLTTVYDPTNGTVSRGNIYRAGGSVTNYAGRTMMN